MIKAIETQYKGYRFRSRLEARWAVFFDALGVKWEYEKEGYDLGEAGWYLPDFWLPDMGIWAEIKGEKASDIEQQKAYKLSAMSKQGVLMIQGSPGLNYTQPEYGIAEYSAKSEIYCGECFDIYDLPCCYPSSTFVWGPERFESLRKMLIRETQYVGPEEWQSKKFAANDEEGRRSFIIDLDKLYFTRKHGKPHPQYIYGRVIDVEWAEAYRKEIRLQSSDQGYVQLQHLNTRILEAHNAARSARFEHGESPI